MHVSVQVVCMDMCKHSYLCMCVMRPSLPVATLVQKAEALSVGLTSRLPLIIVSSVVSQASVISGCFNETNITTSTHSTPLQMIRGRYLCCAVCVWVVRDDLVVAGCTCDGECVKEIREYFMQSPDDQLLRNWVWTSVKKRKWECDGVDCDFMEIAIHILTLSYTTSSFCKLPTC